jgi:hypothetical protein
LEVGIHLVELLPRFLYLPQSNDASAIQKWPSASSVHPAQPRKFSPVITVMTGETFCEAMPVVYAFFRVRAYGHGEVFRTRYHPCEWAQKDTRPY